MITVLITISILVAIMLLIDNRHKYLNLFEYTKHTRYSYMRGKKYSKREVKIVYLGICYIIIPLMIFGLSFIGKDTYKEVEFRGNYIYHVGFNEYWESWVVATCPQQVPCGETCTTNSDGSTSCQTDYCTVYVDCSYCDRNNEYYYVIDEEGKEYKITKQKYHAITKKWKNPLNYNNLYRNIVKSNGCGIDGDNYNKYWDKDIYTSENYVSKVKYENKGKSKNSGYYKFNKITDNDKKEYILYDYPNVNNDNGIMKQVPILGLHNLNLPKSKADSLSILYEHLNGLGNTFKCKVFVCLYPNMDINNAYKQKDYWLGGKRNELVICIGYDSKTKKLTWVNAFGLSDSELAYINIRENIMQNVQYLDMDLIHGKIKEVVKDDFIPKDISYFDFIKVNYSSWYYIVSFILILIACVGLPIFIRKKF